MLKPRYTFLTDMAKGWFRVIQFLKLSRFYWHVVALISVFLPDNLPLHLYEAVKALASEIQSNSEQKGCWSLNNNSESPTSCIREAKGKRIYFFLPSVEQVQNQFLNCKELVYGCQ